MKIAKCRNCNSKKYKIHRVLGTHRYFVVCLDCHLQGRTVIYKRRAINEWNKQWST